MTDYTELKSRLRNGIDFDDSKEAADAIESLERQIAELSKDAAPVAWGIAVEGEMCEAYIIKDTCVREFERRNRLYPDTPRVLVELFTHPANTKAAISAAYEQGKRDALVAQGELIAQEIAAAQKQEKLDESI